MVHEVSGHIAPTGWLSYIQPINQFAHLAGILGLASNTLATWEDWTFVRFVVGAVLPILTPEPLFLAILSSADNRLPGVFFPLFGG
jgi:hypothetical protein